MKTIVTYKGHEVSCYGKLRQDSEIIYALSDGCEGVTDNFDYETREWYLDWTAFVKDWIDYEGKDSFNIVQLAVD